MIVQSFLSHYREEFNYRSSHSGGLVFDVATYPRSPNIIHWPIKGEIITEPNKISAVLRRPLIQLDSPKISKFIIAGTRSDHGSICSILRSRMRDQNYDVEVKLVPHALAAFKSFYITPPSRRFPFFRKSKLEPVASSAIIVDLGHCQCRVSAIIDGQWDPHLSFDLMIGGDRFQEQDRSQFTEAPDCMSCNAICNAASDLDAVMKKQGFVSLRKIISEKK
eukprot:TRINITY_DN4702_c0_g1_i3.p1 TRINITY_DN4702_c0_g1~~TRINITY_DN4702_c0_g1_i3.p1  ORF type:complete len:221 (-),score=44.26 TRINITY_DN4702_c0_g1_i3:505-1167(-)